VQDRDRVLMPFQRVEPSRNRTTGGTGLGLAIAHTVVTRHGGRLAFVDRPGGFAVRVELNRTPH
jgi:signal transduction histidine kinase